MVPLLITHEWVGSCGDPRGGVVDEAGDHQGCGILGEPIDWLDRLPHQANSPIAGPVGLLREPP
jgi:hypothetical protein